MNAATLIVINRMWEETLGAGDRVLAIWNKVVFGKTYTYHALATIERVGGLGFQVRLDDDGGDSKVGKTLTLPRFFNKRRTDFFRAAPIPR